MASSSSFRYFQGVLAAAGLLCCLNIAGRVASTAWLHLRPSSIRRYLHTTDGKPAWALVTGASGGIGKELAHELAGLGFNVVLHGRNERKLERVREELTRAHPAREFRLLIIDASKAFLAADGPAGAEWTAPLRDLNVTVLVNCAGGSTERVLGPIEELSVDRLVTDMSVNALFPTLLARELIPQLGRNAPGLIVNLGSLADLGVPQCGVYASCKKYLSMLTVVLGREMRITGRNVEVLGIRIGNVWGTGQTVAKKQDFFSPDASSMAKAVIGKVGCGYPVVVGHWTHALQFAGAKVAPRFMVENMLIGESASWDMTERNKND